MNKLKFYQYKTSEDGEAASSASLPKHYVGFAPRDSAESQTLPLVEVTQTPCESAEPQSIGPFVILQARRDSVPSGPIVEVTQIRVGSYIEEAAPSSSNNGKLQDTDQDGFSSNRNYQYRDQHSPWVRREMSDMGEVSNPIMRRTAHPTQRETDDSDEMYISRSGLPDIPYPIPEPPRTDQNLRFKREMYGSASQLSLRTEPTTKTCMRAMCCCCCKPDSPPSVVHQGNQTESNRFYVTHSTANVGSFGPHTPHTMPRRGRREVFVRPGLVTRNSRQPGYRSRSCDCL